MKEYKILREIENPRMGPNNRQLLDANINALAKDGWVVHSFSVSQTTSQTGPLVTANTWYCALLERDTPAVAGSH
jgi:hypothetical protein